MSGWVTNFGSLTKTVLMLYNVQAYSSRSPKTCSNRGIPRFDYESDYEFDYEFSSAKIFCKFMRDSNPGKAELLGSRQVSKVGWLRKLK